MNGKNIYVTNKYGDCAKYYNMPVLKYFYSKRARMIIDLVKMSGRNVLDAGCGSGILFYELCKTFSNLNGIDLRDDINNIKKSLEAGGLKVNLIRGSLFDLPYKSDTFDCVVSMSVLEHISDLDQPVKELARVLKKGSSAVIGFPAKNFLMHRFFKIIKFDDEKDHPSGHRDICGALEKKFIIEKAVTFPFFLKKDYSFYVVCRCRKK